MNRRIVYTAQIPLSTDFLQAQKDALQAIGQLAQDMLTSSTAPSLLVGLACTPTNPASMTVNLGPGSVYQQGAVDGTAFGSLLADTTPVLQQGFSTASRNLGGFVSPTIQGQTINYLVQAQFQQVDARPLVLPYYNSANPQVPLVGPGGNGSSQSTDRTGILAVQVVAGAAAVTGSQTTPPVTSGWLPAYVISVAFGQTSIGAPNIVVHSLAPFLGSLTSQHHLGLPGTAPKIDLSAEVQGKLPGAAIETDANGIATGVNAEKLDGYSAADLLNNGSYGQPLATGGGLTRDVTNALEVSWDDGTRQHDHVPRADHSHSNDATGGMTDAPFAKLGSAPGASTANSTVIHANNADSATNAGYATNAGTATSANYATSAGSTPSADTANYAQALKQSGQGVLGIVQSGGHVYLWGNTDSTQSGGNAGTVRVSNADYADSAGSANSAGTVTSNNGWSGLPSNVSGMGDNINMSAFRCTASSGSINFGTSLTILGASGSYDGNGSGLNGGSGPSSTSYQPGLTILSDHVYWQTPNSTYAHLCVWWI